MAGVGSLPKSVAPERISWESPNQLPLAPQNVVAAAGWEHLLCRQCWLHPCLLLQSLLLLLWLLRLLLSSLLPQCCSGPTRRRSHCRRRCSERRVRGPDTPCLWLLSLLPLLSRAGACLPAALSPLSLRPPLDLPPSRRGIAGRSCVAWVELPDDGCLPCRSRCGCTRLHSWHCWLCLCILRTWRLSCCAHCRHALPPACSCSCTAGLRSLLLLL